MKLLKVNDSSLSEFVGNITIIPFFGSDFTEIFPIFILVIFVIFLLDWKNRLLTYFNLDTYNKYIDSTNESVKEKIKEGQALCNSSLGNRSDEIV